jgi:hypothetical protein
MLDLNFEKFDSNIPPILKYMIKISTETKFENDTRIKGINYIGCVLSGYFF